MAAIHAAGAIAVCYVDVGTLEMGRSDYSQFPSSVVGPAVSGWPGENWLLVTAANQPVILPLMKTRFADWCQAKGFDAIEPDNVDGWTNISNISQADNLAYDLAISQLAHALPLSIGLKNLATDLSASQLPMFVGAFDWALNEQCYEYNECDAYTQSGSFLPAGKAVFDVEYNTSPDCTQANQSPHQRPADRPGLGRRDVERLQVHAVRARQPSHLVSARRALRALTGAGLIAGVASCANLGALVCQGDDCVDASSESMGDGGEPGIACGAGSVCDPGSQECCVASGGSTSCTSPSACRQGTDIACDDPRQCPNGTTCWICVNAQGFQGTSCNYQGDIVGQYQCDMTTALPLCHLTSQCSEGRTCKPLPVDGLDAGAGKTWFSACQ